MSTQKDNRNCSLEFWGGIECTINRVQDDFFDQLDISGHYNRADDLELISGLGVKKLRYPILWEKHLENKNGFIDWSFTAQALDRLYKNNITPIAGLLHHGSGPALTSLYDDDFPELFASYARKVAQRFPSLQYYTPINEPLTTARFSGLYGLWHPHMSNDLCFVKMLLNQVKGTILAMREIRKINPRAVLIQTEDLSKTYSSDLLVYQATFENERRWLTYDLLCGKVRREHTMWKYLLDLGVTEENLNFFSQNAMPPDILGCNYYITSERYLDENTVNYPGYKVGGNGIHDYVDVEAIRVKHKSEAGLHVLLREIWERYHLPISITEAHLNCSREDQLRWLDEIRKTCIEAIKDGIEIKAMTFWSLFGSYGWNKLLTSREMDYEPGAFDLRSTRPRPTAIASFIKNSTARTQGDFKGALMQQRGWWHDVNRFVNTTPGQVKNVSFQRSRPIMILGKSGTLGKAFAKVCTDRNLPFILMGRHDIDITDEKIINASLSAFNPWAVINLMAFVKIDRAEQECKECFKVNTSAPIMISKACKERGIAFLTYSSDLVFDGKKETPYIESDPINPLNTYGRSKALAEEGVLKNSNALIVRTSSFFEPWNGGNFAYELLKSLTNNRPFVAVDDIIISPTYVPHLVTASLDLLVDAETGVWHITNPGAITWKDFAIRIAKGCGYDESLVIGRHTDEMKFKAQRPKYSALQSDRGQFLPSIDNALDSFCKEWRKNNLVLGPDFYEQQHKSVA
ncbi:MAG: sugar nucleotide-binding protein [Bacteroidota bacterium]|nr:sugar nucleotide-binding protein [Bacteroidota bacterium]